MTSSAPVRIGIIGGGLMGREAASALARWFAQRPLWLRTQRWFLGGAFGVLARRNIILVVMSLEIMLNAVNIALVAIAIFRGGAAAGAQRRSPARHRHRVGRERP